MGASPDVLDVVLVSPAPGIRESYRARLELDGYSVRVAGDAASGFMEVRRRRPDLLFVDRSSDPEVMELLCHLLARDEHWGFPVVSIEIRPPDRAAGMDGGLGYSLLDDLWPRPVPTALRILDVLEAG